MADVRNDIERYRKGELSPAEMHALEKRALHDPFLADALEGAGALDANAFEADVVELQKRIHTHRKGRFFSPLRIAASLGILLAGAFILYTFLRPPEPVALAQKQVTPPTPVAKQNQEPVASTTTIPEKKSNPNLLSLQRTPRAATHKEEPASSQPAKSAGPALAAGAASASRQGDTVSQSEVLAAPMVNEQIASTSKDKDSVSRKGESAKAMDVLKSAPKSYSYKMKSSPPVIKGKVTSTEDNSPLRGVNVVIKGTRTGTVTDAAGNYEIVPGDRPQSLVFSFIGVTTREEQVEGRDQIDVQLSPDPQQLNEVAVTGYGLANDDDASENLTVQLAEPAGGRKSFNRYLQENLHYPATALQQKTEGKVVIEFTVKSDGALADFKVVHGIGAGCDEELIRLIREGPAWTPNRLKNNPRESKVRVQLKFSLPK